MNNFRPLKITLILIHSGVKLSVKIFDHMYSEISDNYLKHGTLDGDFNLAA